MPVLQVAINASKAQQGAQQVVGALNNIKAAAAGMTQNVAAATARLSLMAPVGYALERSFYSLGATLTAALAIRTGSHTIAEYDQTLKTLKAVTQATDSDIEKMNATIRDLGATTQFRASQAGEALLFLARSGMTTNEALRALPGTLNLATAGQVDLAQAADYTSNILHEFGLSASSTERVIDTLVTTANKSNTDVKLLAESLKFTGPIAAQAGLSLEETAAALGILANNGIKGTLAGTALRGALVSLLDPTKKARDTLADLDIQIQSVNPEANSLIDVFSELAGVNLRASQAVDLFTRREATGALVLSKSIDALKALTKANSESAGEAKRNADIISDSLPIAFKKFRSAVDEAFITLGDRGIREGLRNITDTAAGVVRILVGTKYGLGEITPAAQEAARAIKALAGGFAVLIALEAAVWLEGVIAATNGATAAMKIFNFVLALNPFGLIFTAISAATAALIYYKDTTIEIGEKTVAVGDLVTATIDHFTDKWIFSFHLMGEIYKALYDLIGKSMTQLFPDIANNFSVLFGSIFNQVTGLVGQILDIVKTMTNVWIASAYAVGDAYVIMFRKVSEVMSAFQGFDASDPNTYLVTAARVTSALDLEGTAKEISSTVAADFEKDWVGDMATSLKNSWDAIRVKWKEAVSSDPLFAEFDKFFNPVSEVDDIIQRAASYKALRDEKEKNKTIDDSLEEFFSTTVQEAPSSINRITNSVQALSNEARQARTSFDQMVDKVVEETQWIGMSNAEHEKAQQLFKARQLQAKSEGSITDEQIEGLKEVLDLNEQLRGDYNQSEYLRKLRDEYSLINLSNDERERELAVREAINIAKNDGILIGSQEINAIKQEIAAQQELRKMRNLWEDVGRAGSAAISDIIWHVNTLRDTLANLFQTISQMALQTFALKPLMDLFSGFATSFWANGVTPNAFGMGAYPIPNFGGGVHQAYGGAWSQGQPIYAAAGMASDRYGVLSRPTQFAGAGGKSIVAGEAGPEGFFPLTQVNGKLGLLTSGDNGGTNIVAHIHVHGVTDANSMRRSSGQIAATLSDKLRRKMEAR